GPVPGHDPARGVLLQPHGAGAEGGRRGPRPSVAGAGAGVAVSEGGVLSGTGLIATDQPLHDVCLVIGTRGRRLPVDVEAGQPTSRFARYPSRVLRPPSLH